MQKKIFIIIATFFLTISSGILGLKYLNPSDTKTPFLKQNPVQAVLAATTEAPHFIFKVNVPSFFSDNTQFSKDVNIDGALTVKGKAVFDSSISLNNNNLDLGTGTLTASNVLYGLKAGNGVTITSGQTPTIAVTNTGVSSLQSQTGNLTLTAGSGINIDGLKISATSTNTTQNIFKTISDGTNSFSAGSDSDTLTLTAGTGMTITTDTSNKKLTFSASSGSSGVTGSGFTTNGIMYATGNSAITSLAPGTSGYVLQSNGTSSIPSWVSASSVGTNYWQLNSGILSPATLTNTLAIGATTSLANSGLDIEQNGLGNSVLVVNQKGSGDIFTASASGTKKFTIANDGTVIVGTDGSPTATTIRAGTASGNNTTGSNLTFDASNGTGAGGSGDIIFRTASAQTTPITTDNTVTGGSPFSSNSTSSTSFTIGSNTNRLLIVQIDPTTSTTSVSSVTYNGSNLTKLSSQICPHVVFSNGCANEVWYMLAPTTGSHTLTVNLSTADFFRFSAVSLYNIDQTTPFGTAVTASGTTSTTSSITVNNVTSSQTVMDFLAGDHFGQEIPGTGQTQTWNFSNDPYSSYLTNQTGSVTMTWNLIIGNNQTDWSDIAVPINQLANNTSDNLADRFHITSSGSIGIGTSAPLGSTGLEVQKNSYGNATFVVDNSGGAGDLFTASSAGTAKFVIDKNGDVGIGTTSASQKLDISTSLSSTSINTGGADMLRLINTNGSLNTGAAIDFGVGDTGGGAIARIAGMNLGSYGTGLAFYTHPSNGTSEEATTERMRIDQNGDIGIGTTSTSTNLLNITGSSNDLVAINSTLNTSFNRAFEVLDSSLGTTNNILMDVGHDLSTNNAGYLGFNYQGSGSTSNFLTMGFYGNDNLFNFTAKGNLGIGTSNPAGTLDLVQQTQTSGSPNVLKLTGASNTTLTAATDNDVLFNLARTVQFTGSSTPGAANFTNQNAVQINAPTYTFSSTGSQTITNARTIYINNGPIAGASDTTLTNSYGLQIDNANGTANGGTVTNAYGLEVNEATGATHNYAAYFNGATTIGNNATPNAKEILHVEQYNQTSGSPKIIGVAANSYSGITAATNPDILFDLSHSVGFAGSSTPGAANFTNQYAFQMNAPSYTFNNTGAQTITNAVSQYINGAPSAGSGTGAITLTNSIGLLIDNSNGLDGGGTVTNAYGLYVKQQQTTSTHNYSAYFGAPVVIGNNKTPYVHDALYVMQDPETVNSAQILHLASSAYSTIPAGDNPDVVFDLSHSVQFGGAAGSGVDNIASSSAFEINAPTYSFSGAGTQTVTSAATQYINNPVIAGGGSSITITNDYGLLIDAANSVGGGGTVTNSYGLRVNTSSGATNNYAAIFSGGNVGIGDTAPGNTLKVVGSLCVKNAATTCAGTTSGNIYATNTTVQSADVAENYISSQTLEPGDVIMPAADGNNQAVIKTSSAYQTQTIGVVSTKPGVTLNSDAQTDSTHPNLYPIALQGRVPVKVSTQNGQIHTGDLLTTSNIPGVAMKATSEGQIIGKALEDYLNNDNTTIGKIMVFVNISWTNPNIQIAITNNGDISLNGQPVKPTDIITRNNNLNQQANTDTTAQLQQQVASLSAQIGQINDLSKQLSEIEKTINLNQTLQASNSAGLGLSTEDTTLEGNLTVAGRTTLTDLGITGRITNGLLAVNGLDDSNGTPSATINTLSAPLKIQSLAINGVDFENGKLTIDTNGNLTVNANITANSITTDKLNITTDKTATNSGIVSSSTGTVTIEAGTDNIDIQTTALTSKSLIFLTPNLPVAVGYKLKNSNTFNIYLQQALNQNLKINWWIIN